MFDGMRFRWLLLRHDVHVMQEKWMLRLVWALPRWLVYWATIRLLAHATTGRYGSTVPDSICIMEALKRWRTQ